MSNIRLSETPKSPLILVIEDDPQMRRFLRATLTSNGYDLLEAGQRRKAIKQISLHHPDLIILDLGLPDMDGLEVTSQLREWTNTPIVVLSARDRENDKIVALDAGADDYLTKPFGTGELLARMRVRCVTRFWCCRETMIPFSRQAIYGSIWLIGRSLSKMKKFT